MKKVIPVVFFVFCLSLLGFLFISNQKAEASVRVQASSSFAYECDGKFLRVGVFVGGANTVRFSRGSRDWSGSPARALLSGGRFWNIRLPLITGLRIGERVGFVVYASGPSGSDRAVIRPTVRPAGSGAFSPCPMPAR